MIELTTLVVYYSRTGLSKSAAEKLASSLNGELLAITDGRAYKGVFGYIAAAVVGLKKKLPELLPYKTLLPLEKYERIVVVSPIWCENICPAIRAFLAENRKKLKGELIAVATHMSGLTYREKIDALELCAGKKPDSFLSIRTKNNDWASEVDAFAKKLTERI